VASVTEVIRLHLIFFKL